MARFEAWAQSAAEAFISSEKSESLLQSCGIGLRAFFASAAEAVADPDVRDAFKKAYLERGGNERNVPSYWARVLYQYAFPGEGKASGIYYRDDGEGPVRDAARNARVTPPSSAGHALAPKFLRGIPGATVEDTAALGGFPIRMIVAAGSGSGKTVLAKQLVAHLQSARIVSFTYILTGTLTSHWDGLPGESEVEEFGVGAFDRVRELIEIQKEQVRAKPRSPGSWGRPLIVIDDVGDRKGVKGGEDGRLLDSLFMTARNFGVSVILLNQQTNSAFFLSVRAVVRYSHFPPQTF